MNCTIAFHTSFSGEETDLLWTLGVNMDDWDYALICPPDVVIEEEYQDEETEWVWKENVPQEERVWPREQLSETSYRILGPPFDKGICHAEGHAQAMGLPPL